MLLSLLYIPLTKTLALVTGDSDFTSAKLYISITVFYPYLMKISLLKLDLLEKKTLRDYFPGYSATLYS